MCAIDMVCACMASVCMTACGRRWRHVSGTEVVPKCSPVGPPAHRAQTTPSHHASTISARMISAAFLFVSEWSAICIAMSCRSMILHRPCEEKCCATCAAPRGMQNRLRARRRGGGDGCRGGWQRALRHIRTGGGKRLARLTAWRVRRLRSPTHIVQRMGQRPREWAVVAECCDALAAAVADGGDDAVVDATNARAVAVLLRALRLHGERAAAQQAAWGALLPMMLGPSR